MARPRATALPSLSAIGLLAIVAVMLDSDLKQALKELAESGKMADRCIADMARNHQALEADLAKCRRELEADLARSRRELEASLARSREQVDAALDKLSRQIGGLGNGFGTFTEGLMWSSLQRILRDQLGMHTLAIIPERRRLPDGRDLEVDMLGWTNGTDNRVAVVEIKTHLRRRDLDQFDHMLRRFAEFFPEHKGKTAVGIIAAIGIRQPIASEVNRRGFHLARASDENFELADSPGFRPVHFAV